MINRHNSLTVFFILIFFLATAAGSLSPAFAKTYYTPAGYIPIHVRPMGIAFAMPHGWHQKIQKFDTQICNNTVSVQTYVVSNLADVWIWIDILDGDAGRKLSCLPEPGSSDFCLPLDSAVRQSGSKLRRYIANLRLPNACEWFPQKGEAAYKIDRRSVTVAGSQLTQVSGYVAANPGRGLNRVFVSNAAGKIGGRYVSIGFVTRLPINPAHIQAYEQFLDSFRLADLTDPHADSNSTDEKRLSQLIENQEKLEVAYLNLHRAYLKEVYTSRRDLRREAEQRGSATIDIGEQLQALQALQKNVRILEAHTFTLIKFLDTHKIRNTWLKSRALDAISSGLITVNAEDEDPQRKTAQTRNSQLDLAFHCYLKMRKVYAENLRGRQLFINIPPASLGGWTGKPHEETGKASPRGLIRFDLGEELLVIYPDQRVYHQLSLIERDGKTFMFREIIPKEKSRSFPPVIAPSGRIRSPMSGPRRNSRPRGGFYRLALADNGTGFFKRVDSDGKTVLAEGILTKDDPANLHVPSTPGDVYPKTASLKARLPSESEAKEVLALAGISISRQPAAKRETSGTSQQPRTAHRADSYQRQRKQAPNTPAPKAEDFSDIDGSAADAIIRSGELEMVLGDTPQRYHWWACNAGFAAGNYGLFAKWWKGSYKYAKKRGYTGRRVRPNETLWKNFRIVAHFRPDAFLWLDERQVLGIAGQKGVVDPGKIGRKYSIPKPFAKLSEDPFRP